MSAMNKSGEEQVLQVECPLCMEPLEVDDLHFYPCTCGYQICRFCWNRIREGENGLCPACRKAYPENPADFKPLSQEQVAAIKTEKKAREQKRRNKTLESRKALANVRVVQNNLVFVVGLPVRLADPEILKRQEYFGKYGKIHKVVINQSTTYAGSQGPSASAYVTYTSSADALRAIQGVNNVTLDGRVLKGSLGTTKYCANFMKNQPCPKQDCMYLHELGDPKASFTKEEMHQGLHQIYERKLHNQLAAQTQREQQEQYNIANCSGNPSTNGEKSSSKDGSQSSFIPTTIVTSSNINIVNNSNSKWKKEVSGLGESSSGPNKEAWPSLGSSPPSSESSGSKQPSPKPTATSQEIDTPESSNSPTQIPNKNRETHNQQSKTSKNKDHTNGHAKNKNKKQKSSNSINETSDDDNDSKQQDNAFENDRQNFLSNELDELESDRHSLLENHDLLDNSEHSLLDDETHNLLNDSNTDLLIQRHRDMLSDHLLPIKSSLGNGYLVDRDLGYLGSERQLNQGILEQKELLLRERSRSEMLMRQNEMMRQHNLMSDKHYMPSSSSIGLDSASELLGAREIFGDNMHPISIMPPFGVRSDGTMQNYGLQQNIMPNSSHMTNGFAEPTPMQQNIQQNLQQQSLQQGVSEGRYLGENMDKFFTDFHKNQQIKYLMHKGMQGEAAVMQPPLPAEVQSHAFIESQHLARKYGPAALEHAHHADLYKMHQDKRGVGAASGDCDDDLDFDPFQETQKALAEMMETEMMHTNINSGEAERMRRARMPPPGFTHMNAFGMGHPRPQPTTAHSAQPDWTQMDPAIMSTSVNFPHKSLLQQQQQTLMNQQQQEMFSRFAQINMNSQPNGLNKLLQNGQQMPMLAQLQQMTVQNQRMAGVPQMMNGSNQYMQQQKLGWGMPQFNDKQYASIPLPPGFAPTNKQPQLSAECIDAK